MSLYNLLNGYDRLAGPLLATLGIAPNDIPRFRDCYWSKEREQVVILTRTGGGNREAYESENASLQAHELCVSDHDDEFDSTFALFYFKLPENDECRELRNLLMEKAPDETSLREKTERFIQRMKGTTE